MNIVVSQRFPELAGFVKAVENHYGSRLHGIYLFGSRARGDYRVDSDYDVAVVLKDDSAALWREQDALADIAFDTLFEREIFIQPLPFMLKDWRPNAEHRDLVRAIRRDSIELVGG